MSRLIDADALSRIVKLAWETSDSEDFEKSVFIAIATAPTIEERKNIVEIPETGIGDLSDGFHVGIDTPEGSYTYHYENKYLEPDRKNGKWIMDDEYIDCSVCRHDKWSRAPFEDLVKRFKFCPNCGADMRGDGNETD